MSSDIWLPLSSEERTLLREALAAYAVNGDKESALTLSNKIARCPPHPDIAIRASGGVIQGITGNPFPIRVCDYDEDDDMDENGERCGLWFEQPDKNAANA
jgi:hypothetical protein